MFTGIVEESGEVTGFEETESGARLRIRSSFSGEVSLGESIAVNGACLTVVETNSERELYFDLLDETLRLTNLGDLQPGADRVNLERSLRVGDRLSGHFVQGHVDRCAEILALEESGADYRLVIELPGEFRHLVVYKGSICVNGISLTVAELDENSLTIWIIPHTFEVTNLNTLGPGARVNLEFDLLAKHLARLDELRR